MRLSDATHLRAVYDSSNCYLSCLGKSDPSPLPSRHYFYIDLPALIIQQTSPFVPSIMENVPPLLFFPSPIPSVPSSSTSDARPVTKRAKDELVSHDGLYGDQNGSPHSHEKGSEDRDRGKQRGGHKKVRRPRFAFQTRSQVDILDDGYRWRKYGQKAVKNNKFPRSYYRCTYQGCNVKKQVQRLTTDEGVVVTTYEGMHSHPIERTTDNFEHILSQMQIYATF